MHLEVLRLLARDACEPCSGTGAQVSEDWQGFEAWAGRRGLNDLARDENVEHYFLEVCDFDAVPPMRDDCDTCSGRGTVDVELPVSDLLDLIVSRIETPIVPAGDLDETVDHLKHSMTSAALKSQGLADPLDVGSWLRACQEAAEALRSVAELRPRRSEA